MNTESVVAILVCLVSSVGSVFGAWVTVARRVAALEQWKRDKIKECNEHWEKTNNQEHVVQDVRASLARIEGYLKGLLGNG